MNAIPSKLRDRPLYSYIVTTIKTIPPHYELRQTGSAPNFAGGRITLCTCKHKDRATIRLSDDPGDPWKGVWIAGLTSKSEDPSRSLAYLMFVDRSFLTQHDIWESLPAQCREQKCASNSDIGDLYRPKEVARRHPNDPASYHAPKVGKHVHSTARDSSCWHGDIERWGKRDLPHRLLLGHDAQSYRWPITRMILRLDAIGRSAHHAIYDSVREFIKDLREFDP